MMRKADFEREVTRIIAAIPDEFRTHLGDVAFIVEDRADDELLAEAGYGAGEELLGFFRGYPLSERQHDLIQLEPDMIYLFQESIEAESRCSGLPIRRVIRETVLHEVAHFFGFTEDDMDRIEALWAEQQA